MLAVRWYLRFALSYRDVEELLAERGVEVDWLPSSLHAAAVRWTGRDPSSGSRRAKSLTTGREKANLS